jgi:hypothetical protein
MEKIIEHVIQMIGYVIKSQGTYLEKQIKLSKQYLKGRIVKAFHNYET